ncbi:hypothetical protein GCK32_021287 [Trichostrongylus colubriformis]|uniref:Uncharacterized protein n=1 Tax=Trichostrongylus colubriformis TaxID=6319 RepID=A0AAN8FIY0_TRICO
MRQNICVYFQLFPLCGFFVSSILLLSVAFDRLMSLQRF